MPWRSECIEREEHAPGIVGAGPNPQVEILGRPGEAMRRHRISTNDQELNLLFDEC